MVARRQINEPVITPDHVRTQQHAQTPRQADLERSESRNRMILKRNKAGMTKLRQFARI